MPEWLKGTGCKPVGYAYVGSNPTPSTTVFSRIAEWARVIKVDTKTVQKDFGFGGRRIMAHYPSLPSWRCGFDSRRPLQKRLN